MSEKRLKLDPLPKPYKRCTGVLVPGKTGDEIPADDIRKAASGEVMYESDTLVAQVAENEANGNADHSCTKIRFSTSL